MKRLEEAGTPRKVMPEDAGPSYSSSTSATRGSPHNHKEYTRDEVKSVNPGCGDEGKKLENGDERGAQPRRGGERVEEKMECRNDVAGLPCALCSVHRSRTSKCHSIQAVGECRRRHG